MMCDTSLAHTASGPKASARRPSDDASDRPRNSLTRENEETTKVIDKP
ncbi:hypothetical protein J2Z21_004057 [Streptomyces griseochromogenes]|uniref:Transposase n=1 Tax=Streptomyces griseochromogenes TaxID=68214 RepID=A0ABS4LV63_9ACTN|nr:hypothetical protein [Streptomyces griseochromogenes]